MMRKTLLLLALILPLIGMVAQNIDVKHYDISISDINFSDHSINGHTEVSFEVLTDIENIELELKSLIVSDVTINHESIVVTGYNQHGDSLTINLSGTLPSGSEATVVIDYGGVPFHESSFGGIHWNNGVMYNLGVGFNSCPHNLGKAWFPCVDNMTDKATFTVHVTADDGLTAVCGGLLIDKTLNGNGTSTWSWNIPQETTTYAASITVGEYALFEDVYQGQEADIPINIFVKEANLNKIDIAFGNLKEIMAFFEECFGPYPYNRIGYCETTLGCMEHVDNISFASSVIGIVGTGEEYAAHELVHMWFGNMVTCKTPQDMWLNEGLAQFCTLFFKTGLYGEDAYISDYTSVRDKIVNWCDKEQNWIALNDIPESITYDSDGVYDRGAVVAATMMNYMGRENFINALKQYLERFAYSNASSEDLRDALTEFSGIDMTGFFDTWVFTHGMPHFAAESMTTQATNNGYEATIEMSYSHRGSNHIGQNNICKVTFIGDNLETHTDTVRWNGEFGTTTKHLDFEPITAIADYDNEYLNAVLSSKTMVKNGSSYSTLVRFFEVNKASVSDSVYVYAANHLVGPKETETDPALKISTRHYWTVFSHDYGENTLGGRFTFSRSTWDNDIVTSQSDSAVLLYRRNANEPWQSINYEQEGNWQLARFTVNDLQNGDYVIGAWDKDLLAVEKYNTPTKEMSVSPNPTTNEATISWQDNSSGIVTIFDEKGKLVNETYYHNTDKITLNISGLAQGIYIINRTDTNKKTETCKLIIK